MTPSLTLTMVLPAPTVEEWLSTHLRSRFDDLAEGADRDSNVALLTLADVLADDAAVIRTRHERVRGTGVPGPAAATYMVEWFAGILATSVGYALAIAGAGLILDGPDAAQAIRFRLHPDGWPCGVELQAKAVVHHDHPWAAHGDAEVVDTSAAVVTYSVHALVNATEPIIGACHRLARVGRAGLWNEVADSLGKAVAFQQQVTPTSRMLAVLGAAVAAPGVPWKARPRLGFVDSDALGPVHVAQKGGCCLAYTAPVTDIPSADDPDLDPDHQAFLQRFPIEADQPRYCTTCSFRDPADSTARQVVWQELRTRARN